MLRTSPLSFRAAWIALVALCAPVAFAPAAARDTAAAGDAVWTTVWDHWYEMDIDGATAGWTREHVTSRADEYRTASEMVFRLRRGDAEIELRMESTFTERHDGTPVSLQSIQSMGHQPVYTRWEFRDDHVRSVSKSSRAIEKRLPLPEGTWLTPMASHRYRLARMEADAAKVVYRTIDEEQGLEPVTVTHERQGRDMVELDGRSVPVTVWKTTSSAMPGMHSITRVSADGHLVRDETTLPFGKVVTRLSTKSAAMAAGRGPAPEMMVRTFVEVNLPIPRVRETTSATLRLRTRDGAMPALPNAGAQRVEVEPSGSVLLHIDITDNLPADPGDADGRQYAEATTMIDGDDALIRTLARKACRGVGDDPLARADALRDAVHRHISAKSLDTAFATASETARMRAGDCSEHAVLLCAMMRSSGLPARVATGLVYADYFGGEKDIFGWHMWTQALIDGRWVDFDATLDRRYDAAHVLVGTSSLADGVGGMNMESMLMLMGNLRIEVVEVAY